MQQQDLQTDGSRPTPQRIFPLHLSPMEIFMLADDQPDYPMTFVVQLRLAGQIDRAAFEASLREALERHPLFRALIKSAKQGLPCWTLAEDARPALDWQYGDAPLRCSQGESIDLTREVGLRLWVRHTEQQATVTLQFHHACSDGTGAYRFIGDLLAGYGIRTASSDPRPEFGPLNIALLRTRKDSSLTLPAHAPSRQRTPLALAEWWKILRHQPSPLASLTGRLPPERRDAAFPGYLCFSFDRATHERLRQSAGLQGTTLNDLLLRDLFVTLHDWQHERLSWFRTRRLRIMMPTDLRETQDYEMPAANLVAYTLLACEARDISRPDELLRIIRAKTALIKHERSGMRFVDMAYAASKWPRLLSFGLRCGTSMATAILSNVADPSRRFSARLPRRDGRIVAGNLLLEEITGVPPLRRKTRATFSISQYDRRLTISLRCDPHHFRRADTALLLDRYVEQIKRSAP